MATIAAIRRRWWVVLVLLLLGVLGAGVATSLMTTTYESQSKLLLTPVASDSATAFGATNYVATRGRAYANLAGSGGFLKQVQESLGVQVGSKYPSISVDLETDTTLLTITAQDTSAEGARDAVQRVDDLLVRVSRDLDATTAGDTQVRMDVVADPLLPGAPSSLSWMTVLATGGLIGMGLGASAAVAIARSRGELLTSGHGDPWHADETTPQSSLTESPRSVAAGPPAAPVGTAVKEAPPTIEEPRNPTPTATPATGRQSADEADNATRGRQDPVRL
jgi:capsular polysaccharide biosynthesis protein